MPPSQAPPLSARKPFHNTPSPTTRKQSIHPCARPDLQPVFLSISRAPYSAPTPTVRCSASTPSSPRRQRKTPAHTCVYTPRIHTRIHHARAYTARTHAHAPCMHGAQTRVVHIAHTLVRVYTAHTCSIRVNKAHAPRIYTCVYTTHAPSIHTRIHMRIHRTHTRYTRAHTPRIHTGIHMCMHTRMCT